MVDLIYSFQTFKIVVKMLTKIIKFKYLYLKIKTILNGVVYSSEYIYFKWCRILYYMYLRSNS